MSRRMLHDQLGKAIVSGLNYPILKCFVFCTVSLLCTYSFSQMNSMFPDDRRVIDTTMIMSIERCSDSTIWGCWSAIEGEFPIYGLYIYDTTRDKILYDRGFFIYLNGWGELPSSIDSVSYLGHHWKRGETIVSLLQLGCLVDSILQVDFPKDNTVVTRREDVDKRLENKREQERVRKKYYINPVLHPNVELSSLQVYSLFKVQLSAVNWDLWEEEAQRAIVRYNGGNVQFDTVSISPYFIYRINKITPYLED